jgi:dihydrofolate reductase
MKVSLIASIGENRELGKDGRIPWFIPGEQLRFKRITMGHPVIMGRKTYESIPEKYRPLKGRINIIISRNKEYIMSGCIVCHSLPEALESAKKTGKKEVFVAGGGQIYKQAIALTDKLYLTVIKAGFEADTFFPDYSQFKKVVSKKKIKNKKYQYCFLELKKIK